MKTRDYQAVASALRGSLNMSERWRVFIALDPVLRENNPRYNARKFGEQLGVPLTLLNIALAKRDKENHNAQEASEPQAVSIHYEEGNVGVEDFHSL